MNPLWWASPIKMKLCSTLWKGGGWCPWQCQCHQDIYILWLVFITDYGHPMKPFFIEIQDITLLLFKVSNIISSWSGKPTTIVHIIIDITFDTIFEIIFGGILEIFLMMFLKLFLAVFLAVFLMSGHVYFVVDFQHGPWTPNEAFFHWNPELFGLGRQFGQINSGAFGIFSTKLMVR